MTDTGASERLLREFQTIQRQIDALPPVPVRLYGVVEGLDTAERFVRKVMAGG